MLGYLFGESATDDEYLARLEAFMVGTADLFTRFITAAHTLVAIGFVTLGCKKRRGVRHVEEPDPT